MNQGRIWCVVKPTVGLPLFLGGVATISLLVHASVLTNTTWMANYWQGAAPRTPTGRVSENGAITPSVVAATQGNAGFAVTIAPVTAADGATSFVVTVTPSGGQPSATTVSVPVPADRPAGDTLAMVDTQ